MKKLKLENMPTYELDKMLQIELRQDPPNGELIRKLLRILEGREKDNPVEITPEIQAAWDKFNSDDTWRADRWKPTARSWVTKVAATAASVAILCSVFLFVMPVEAHAETWREKIERWTDTVFEFIGWQDKNKIRQEYEFKTDNPGLQEVYDAVVELGVTEPVVPMWLPDGYEIKECKTTDVPAKKYVQACFFSGANEIIYKIDVTSTDMWHEYQKDERDLSEYETGGVVHKIMQNNDRWIVIWTQSDFECSLSIDCDEETLHEILCSIYILED